MLFALALLFAMLAISVVAAPTPTSAQEILAEESPLQNDPYILGTWARLPSPENLVGSSFLMFMLIRLICYHLTAWFETGGRRL
jgi:hypothetical protein